MEGRTKYTSAQEQAVRRALDRLRAKRSYIYSKDMYYQLDNVVDRLRSCVDMPENVRDFETEVAEAIPGLKKNLSAVLRFAVRIGEIRREKRGLYFFIPYGRAIKTFS